MTTHFLPALGLSDRPSAHRAAAALSGLFLDIKSQYCQCPMAQQLERHCSLGSVFQRAEPLVKVTSVATAEAAAGGMEEAEAMDISGLFATPASKGSMQVGGAFTSPDTSSKRSGVGLSQGLTSTWHSTASTDVKMTLTSSAEKVFTVTSNCTADKQSPAGTLVGSPPPPTLAKDTSSGAKKEVPTEKKKKKKKRGCRAGKLTKESNATLNINDGANTHTKPTRIQCCQPSCDWPHTNTKDPDKHR